MTGAGFRREPSENVRFEATSDGGDRALFDAVLRETESAFLVNSPDGSALIADLRHVARTYPGQEFQPDPIGLEMVRVLLDRQVSRTVAASRMWRRASDQVAQTLCDDPVARERLEKLWGYLQGNL